MATSRQIARILGPALVAVGISEAVNIDIFVGAPSALVYLDGMVLFVAGLAIIQGHNRWSWDWPLLVTLAGWTLTVGGLYRMFAPALSQAARGAASDVAFAFLVAIGGLLSFKAYSPDRSAAAPPDPKR